jgi:cell division control protein 45
MLNCGGILDLADTYQYPPSISVYVFDVHRPYHLSNVQISNERVVIVGVEEDETFPPLDLTGEDETDDEDEEEEDLDADLKDEEGTAEDGSDGAERAEKRRKLRADAYEARAARQTERQARRERRAERQRLQEQYYRGMCGALC